MPLTVCDDALARGPFAFNKLQCPISIAVLSQVTALLNNLQIFFYFNTTV